MARVAETDLGSNYLSSRQELPASQSVITGSSERQKMLKARENLSDG